MQKERFIGPLSLLLVWFIITYTGLIGPFFLPTPVVVLKKLVQIIISGVIFDDIAKTFYRMLSGFMIAASIGIPLGIFVGYWVRIYNSFEFVIDFFRSVPATALFPLFMLFFGIGDGAKIAIIVFSCSLIILVNTMYGVKNSAKTRIMVAKTMKAPRSYILARVILPEALPEIFAGLRISLSLSLIIIVVLEMFIGTKRGLGYLIYNAHMSYSISEMYSVIIIVGVIGYLLNKGFVCFEKRLVHWAGQ